MTFARTSQPRKQVAIHGARVGLCALELRGKSDRGYSMPTSWNFSRT